MLGGAQPTDRRGYSAVPSRFTVPKGERLISNLGDRKPLPPAVHRQPVLSRHSALPIQPRPAARLSNSTFARTYHRATHRTAELCAPARLVILIAILIHADRRVQLQPQGRQTSAMRPGYVRRVCLFAAD